MKSWWSTLIHEATRIISLLFKSNFSSLWLPFMHNFRSLTLLFRHVNHISSKNCKHLQPNPYLYSLWILFCLLALAMKCVSSHSQKNIIMCFMHSQKSSLKCLFESPCLPSFLSPLYFQNIFLIRKNYIWQDKLRKLEFRYLNRLQWGGLNNRTRRFPPIQLISSYHSYPDWKTWQRLSNAALPAPQTIYGVCAHMYYP